MRFKNPYFHVDVFFTPTGEDTVPDYQLTYDENGKAYLREVGVINTYAKIQAARSECDLENVIRSVSHTQQNSVPTLDYVDSFIADFSKVHSLGDLLSASKNINSLWDNMPLEVREAFGSNQYNFARDFGSENFRDKLQSGYDMYFKVRSESKKIEPDVPSKVVTHDGLSSTDNLNKPNSKSFSGGEDNES